MAAPEAALSILHQGGLSVPFENFRRTLHQRRSSIGSLDSEPFGVLVGTTLTLSATLLKMVFRSHTCAGNFTQGIASCPEEMDVFPGNGRVSGLQRIVGIF